MEIADLQREIEESLASLSALPLPSELQGLRNLPVDDCNPQVSIHNASTWRKIREDASAGYFDPDTCVVMIKLVPLDAARHEAVQGESGSGRVEGSADTVDVEAAMDQLIAALETAEGVRPFVGLTWFRDHLLPESGHSWARDPEDERLPAAPCDGAAPDPDQPGPQPESAAAPGHRDTGQSETSAISARPPPARHGIQTGTHPGRLDHRHRPRRQAHPDRWRASIWTPAH